MPHRRCLPVKRAICSIPFHNQLRLCYHNSLILGDEGSSDKDAFGEKVKRKLMPYFTGVCGVYKMLKKQVNVGTGQHHTELEDARTLV